MSVNNPVPVEAVSRIAFPSWSDVLMSDYRGDRISSPNRGDEC